MAIEPLSALPDVLVAGTTVAWSHVVPSEYGSPGGDYAVTTYFRGPSAKDVTAAGVSGAWVSTLTAAHTAALAAGTYQWETHAIGGGGTTHYVIESGTLTVQPSLATAVAGELLSHEEQALPVLEANYRDLAAQPLTSYTIGEREGVRQKLADLRREIAVCRAAIARQRNGGKLPAVQFAFTRAS